MVAIAQFCGFGFNVFRMLIEQEEWTQQQIEEGIRIYQNILRTSKVKAGIRTNLGVAKILTDDWLNAAAALENALGDCGNYEFAALTLSQCNSTLGGNTEKVAHLEKQFGWLNCMSIFETSSRADDCMVQEDMGFR